MQVESKSGLGGALAIALLASCGGSNIYGASGPFTTSVPAGTSLGSLTSQQKAQFCADLVDYRPKVAPEACARKGIIAASSGYYSSGTPDSALEMACTAAYNSCLNPDGGATAEASSCESTLTGISSTCSYTVGDFTVCLNMQIALDLQGDSNLPRCSSLTKTSLNAAVAALADAGTGGGLSAACMAINGACSSMTTPTVGLVAAVKGLRSARQ